MLFFVLFTGLLGMTIAAGDFEYDYTYGITNPVPDIDILFLFIIILTYQYYMINDMIKHIYTDIFMSDVVLPEKNTCKIIPKKLSR